MTPQERLLVLEWVTELRRSLMAQEDERKPEEFKAKWLSIREAIDSALEVENHGQV